MTRQTEPFSEYLDRLHESPVIKLILWAKRQGYTGIDNVLQSYASETMSTLPLCFKEHVWAGGSFYSIGIAE